MIGNILFLLYVDVGDSLIGAKDSYRVWEHFACQGNFCFGDFFGPSLPYCPISGPLALYQLHQPYISPIGIISEGAGKPWRAGKPWAKSEMATGPKHRK